MAQPSSPTVSDTRYILALIACLAAFLAMRLIAVHTSAIDLVTDEAQSAAP